MKPVIVVMAYKRPLALRRLLAKLVNAEYPQDVKLIISIDGSAPQSVINEALAFECEKLDIQLIQHERRLGLRAHMIKCADLSKDYGSVIVLEDDLIVDRYFYLYACAALDFYREQKLISGIALYSHEYNELAGLPFTAMSNGYDTYPMQIACSSGQCWTSDQWTSFKTWYAGKTQQNLEDLERLPSRVKCWPETSWKKYFNGYMVDTGKFFIYPYRSYSTNCSDSGGEHIVNGTFIHQVSLATSNRPIPNFSFSPADNKEVVYDSFMEPVGDFVWRSIGYSSEEIEIDLQGIKTIDLLKKKKFTITVKHFEKPLKIYGLGFRPAEMNMLNPVCKKADAVWSLALTDSLDDKPIINHSLDRFSYYACMKLNSKVITQILMKRLPMALMHKLVLVIGGWRVRFRDYLKRD
jgi:hypothetical protein